MKRLKQSQFGVMSVQYQQYSLAYCLDSIVANGFRTLDFWGGAPHYCAIGMSPAERGRRVREIRSMLDDRGLRMSVFTAEQICLYPINIASSNPYVRGNSIGLVKGYIEDAKVFGAEHFFVQMGYGLFDEDAFETKKRSVEALCMLAEYAEQVGVRLCMEQLQQYECNICYNKAMLKELVDAVASPNLSICVDCVAAAAAGETPEDYYRAFGDRIAHVHLADGDPTGHKVPGDGSNPLSEYLRQFAEHGYAGSVTLEINNQMYFPDPDAAVRRAAEWMRGCDAVEP
jgi:protein FrlC